MTRVEAYKLMLEGKQVIHPKFPDSAWAMGSDRIVRANDTTLDWSEVFFLLDTLHDGWSLHDKN